jgi:hypothetical protein
VVCLNAIVSGIQMAEQEANLSAGGCNPDEECNVGGKGTHYFEHDWLSFFIFMQQRLPEGIATRAAM